MEWERGEDRRRLGESWPGLDQRPVNADYIGIRRPAERLDRCECIDGYPSHVLWALAHGHEPHPGVAVLEEMGAHTVQRWLRANERPIVGSVDWDDLKACALALLDAV